jgi:hypothetical protein
MICETNPSIIPIKRQLILAQRWVDTTDIKNTLTYGDVDFDKSNIKVRQWKTLHHRGQNSQKIRKLF